MSTAESVGHDWEVYGHDLANTRTNVTENVINAASVATLTKSWETDGVIGVTGTPIVAGGIAYFADWNGMAHAVRAKTGEAVWSSAVGGMPVGAPAVNGDGVYVSSGTTLFKLDRKTGAKQWSVKTDDHP